MEWSKQDNHAIKDTHKWKKGNAFPATIIFSKLRIEFSKKFCVSIMITIYL